MPADIVGWAAAEMLEVITAVPPCRTEAGEHLGIVAVCPADIMPMFRRDGSGPRRKAIHGIRALASAGPFLTITTPFEGIEVDAADIMVTNATVERFEEEHDIVKRADARGGSAAKWDWEAFWRAVLRRVHNHGLPPTQRALAIEMQEWFMRRSDTGEAPDERTIMRKLSQMWRELDQDAEAEP
jgi:hypothetical protein